MSTERNKVKKAYREWLCKTSTTNTSLKSWAVKEPSGSELHAAVLKWLENKDMG